MLTTYLKYSIYLLIYLFPLLIFPRTSTFRCPAVAASSSSDNRKQSWHLLNTLIYLFFYISFLSACRSRAASGRGALHFLHGAGRPPEGEAEGADLRGDGSVPGHLPGILRRTGTWGRARRRVALKPFECHARNSQFRGMLLPSGWGEKSPVVSTEPGTSRDLCHVSHNCNSLAVLVCIETSCHCGTWIAVACLQSLCRCNNLKLCSVHQYSYYFVSSFDDNSAMFPTNGSFESAINTKCF